MLVYVCGHHDGSCVRLMHLCGAACWLFLPHLHVIDLGLASARRGSLAFCHLSPCALFLALRPLGGVRWLSSRMQMYHKRRCCVICLVRCAMGRDVFAICMQIHHMFCCTEALA